VTKTELSEYVEIIIFSTHRLMKLIDDIIEVSKIETGQVLLIERPFSPDLLMDEMKDYTEGEKQKMGKRDIEVDIASPGGGQRVTLFADMERLRMVMINLIDNALKFTKSGHIRFGYKIIGEQVKFSIEDSGIGIPLECQDDIFNRFYQLDNDNNRQFQGTGLGLTIARGLLDIMGGKIWLESEVDCGTTVHFTIPCRTEGRDMELMQKQDYSFDFTGHTILIVEDDLINSRLLGSMIQTVNGRVLYAYTGVMAIEMVKNIPDIDLVLMDIQMPGMDGLEATRNIRFWRKDLPVISQSASAHADDLKRCFDAGCVGHISKPIDTFKLYMLMGKYLKK
jgi:CheY-like chemotaxis protein/anti-sigma regulatory factor (Ser/Thr protein kinase)